MQEQIRKRDTRRPFNREKVQQALEDLLSNHQSEPISTREVARRLGYPVRTIKGHFPTHCRGIAHHYAEHRKQQGQLRKAHLRQRIYEAVRTLNSQELPTTYQRVGAVLNTPGCFREHEARCALLDARSQLAREAAGDQIAETIQTALK